MHTRASIGLRSLNRIINFNSTRVRFVLETIIDSSEKNYRLIIFLRPRENVVLFSSVDFHSVERKIFKFHHSFHSSRDRRSTLKQKIHCFHFGGGELRTASGEIPRIYLLTPDVRGIICLATRLRLLLI